MLTEERVHTLLAQNTLAEVVGFETDAVALAGEGARLTAYGGREFIDFTGGIAVHACGHNHPEIVAAIAQQAEQILHVSDIMRHTPQLELGAWIQELFAHLLPGAPWSFLFLNSGSESIDAAAKLALKVTGRSHFVAFEGAFHGRTLFATALSHSKRLHWEAYEPFLAPLRKQIHHAPHPRSMDGLEALLEQIGEEVAAVYFEAQQGEGGYLPMTPEQALRLREL